MRKNNRGFTLVELLAVIVILGLLMAIAIPSVTKYITQSRIKTLVTTMDSYVTAVVTQVNNGEYKFSDSTKIFAIPIECISLEKGGTNPFGNWYQANSSYWAYVLIHYDNENYNYEYGFTFKDDAGYGLYPTLNSKITNSMVRTGYDDLNQPKNGKAIEYASIDKWEGFANITETTELVVLESASEGSEGDGKNTCTLCQKGSNYNEVEKTKEERYKKGRKICFGEECFYLVSTNGDKATLLAEKKIELSTNKPKQNDSAGENIFSTNRYWCTYSEIYPGYGTSYPTFVYDSNSDVYKYVEAYEKYLKEDIGLKNVSASLISQSQLINDLNCSDSGCESSPYIDWIKKDYNWWTGSALFCDHLLYVNNAGHTYYFWTGVEVGVRPVITIDKYELNK